MAECDGACCRVGISILAWSIFMVRFGEGYGQAELPALADIVGDRRYLNLPLEG